MMKSFEKIARDGNMVDEAEQEVNAKDFTTYVSGQQARENATTGQARSGYATKTRTGEKQEYSQSMRHRWRSSRG